jgi:hypothetical protein
MEKELGFFFSIVEGVFGFRVQGLVVLSRVRFRV